MRRVGALATALATLGLACAATAAEPDPGGIVSYACSPPLPQAASNCDGWHTTSVSLIWGWPADYSPVGSPDNGCSLPNDVHVFDQDTAGTRVACLVSKAGFTDPHTAAVTIQIDKTAPTVTGFTPDRAPDNDGWWNHPVSLQFSGTDATSGIAGCDVVSYAGPDGAAAPVTAGCRDVAGNANMGTFAIKYDSTPPVLAAMPATTEVGQTTLNWTTSADSVRTRIVRSPGIGTAPASEVYSGPDHTFTDSGVTGGKTYTYAFTAFDQAANTASTSLDVTAKPAPQASPAKTTAPSPRLPRLRWRKVKAADYYNVQLYRGDKKILSVWPHLNRYKLHRAWTFRGKRRVLVAGSYHWYVWPGYGRRAEHRYGKLIAHRRFKIAAPAQSARR
jgi:hypothetical protein